MKTKPTSIIQHKWTFKSRFRKQAFGWRSNPAITRIKEAISEIKKVARKNPILGADGAVLFLEKLSPAIENIDSSSGAIGVATYHAVEALVPIIASAPAENKTRDKWLTRLWVAIEKDEIPYIESITPHWGDLCVTPQCASRWANDFIVITRDVLSAQNNGLYFKGTTICLSSLLKAKRYEEILSLVNNCPYVFWHYRVWGVKSLAAMGKINEAIEYAHNSIGLNDSYYCMAVLCEKILLDNHRFEEAYEKYAYKSNQKGTYLATFRGIVKKYPHKTERDILNDLISKTPKDKGKWFASAKSAHLLKEASELVKTSPCDPKTLIRAVRDLMNIHPECAIEIGISAIKWLLKGYGYEVTGKDAQDAYIYTIEAAKNINCTIETTERICEIIKDNPSCDPSMLKALLQFFEKE